MNWLHRLLRRKEMEERLEKELRFHLDQHAEDLIADGVNPTEATRRARIAVGGPEQVKEECRDARGTRWFEDLVQDIRYAARRLRSNPGFTAVCVLTLALGIGASTAIFSAVNPIIFEPLPYPESRRIVTVWDTFQGARSDVTFHTYRELAARNQSLEQLAVMKPWQPTLRGRSEPERFDGQSVSAGYFRVLGVSPALGRDFLPSDDVFHGPKVVILSDSMWRRRFDADKNIVGQTITLDDDTYTVEGVMPADFDNVLAASAQLWTTLQYDPSQIGSYETREWGHHLRMAGRMRPGVGLGQLRSELDLIANTPVPDFPRPRWASLKSGFIVSTLQDDVTRGVRTALLAVLSAVVLLLMIACVNVTNLLLARGAQRRSEFAMRAALGASRGTLVRQLLTESLFLSVMGAIAGLAVAGFGVGALVSISPPGLPRVNAIRIDGQVFVFALCVTVLVGLAIGLIPAIQGTGWSLINGIRERSHSATGSHQRARQVLVVSEVALALVLLVSAGLLMRSMQRLLAVSPGFDLSNLITMQVQTSGHRFDYYGITEGDVAKSAGVRFFADALNAVKRVPAVTAAAFTSQLPLSGDQYGSYGAQFEDGNGYDTFRYVVTPGYLETMGIPLLRGRLLTVHDNAGTTPVTVISESLARSQFGDRDPIGQRVHIGPLNRPWYTVVGVVGDVRQESLALNEAKAVYLTPEQSWFPDDSMSLVVRGNGDVRSLVPALKSAIWSVDSQQPILRVATMEGLIDKTAAQRKFTLILFEAFSVAAFLLAAVGVYGILSGSVTERTREIGIRSALGASRSEIVGMIARQGLLLMGLGMGIGLIGAAGAGQIMKSLLFGVSRLDVPTYVGVIAILVAGTAVSCCVPALRAARIDPSTALRIE